MKALVSYSLRDSLGSIGCPVLLVSADRDYTSIAEKQEDAVRLRNARVAVIEGSRHFTLWDQPERLNAVMLEFLDTG
jgi:pimeloyl-ACP methyl ester carboxylesterase